MVAACDEIEDGPQSWQAGTGDPNGIFYHGPNRGVYIVP